MRHRFTHPQDRLEEGPVRHKYVSCLSIDRVRFWLVEELSELSIANTFGDNHEITDAIIDSLPLLYEYYYFRQHPEGNLANKAVETAINAVAKIWLSHTILLNDVILFRIHQRNRGREVPPLFDYIWMYHAVYIKMRSDLFAIKSTWHNTYHERGHVIKSFFLSLQAKDRLKGDSKVQVAKLTGIGVFDVYGDYLPLIRGMLNETERTVDEKGPSIVAELINDKTTTDHGK